MNPPSQPPRERLARFYGDVFAQHRNRPGFDPRAVELFLNLIRTGDLIRNVVERRMRRHGVTAPAFGLLMLVSARPEGLPMNEIGERMLVTRANITGLVDTIERRGLVERLAHRTDRRVNLIRITSKGRRKLDEVLPGHFRFISGLLKPVGPSERKAVVRALENVRTALARVGGMR